MNIRRLLFQILSVVSFGFCVYPMDAWENPAHPKSPEEMEREEKLEQRKHAPEKELMDDDQRKHYEDGEGDWASRDK